MLEIAPAFCDAGNKAKKRERGSRMQVVVENWLEGQN
jgi:hypothetical protein